MVASFTAEQPSWKYTTHAVIHEFLDKSSIHGAQYIVRSDFNWMMRTMWLIVLGTAVWGAWATSVAFIDSSNRPIDVTVVQTNLDGISLPFPALVVCPISSIRRTVGVDYIRRFLSTEKKDQLTGKQLQHALAILQAFRFPNFNNVVKHTLLFKDDIKLEEYFSLINMTDLALTAFPRCEDVFVDCFWDKGFVNCCDFFHVQFTEFGLCYSFNSLSSENRKHCRLNDDFRLDRSAPKECILKSNSIRHSYQDFKVAIKAATPAEMVQEGSWFGGYLVKPFSPAALPEPANGYYMSGTDGHLDLQVTRFLTFASTELKDMSPETRRCWFPSERRGSEVIQTPVYSSDICFLECHLSYLSRTCSCRPYMIKIHLNTSVGRSAICNFSKMKCYAELIEDRTRFSGSDVFEIETVDSQCAECLPPCLNDVTEVAALRTQHDSLLHSVTFEGTPASNVFLASGVNIPSQNVSTIQLSRNDKRPSNVYLRRERPELVDKLGIYGGIAGLFLGVGALIVFETLYFSLRGMAVFLQLCLVGRQRRRVLHTENQDSNLFQKILYEKF